MPTTKVVKVFYCCSDSAQDEQMRKKLENHLSILTRQGVITSWHRSMISPGKERESEIDKHLKTSDIILVLISSEFTASDSHWDVLAKQAMEQHKAGTSRVIAILLRPVDDYWKAAFPKVKVLPQDGIPVIKRNPQDTAFKNIAIGIREVAEELTDSTYFIKKVLHWLWAIVILVGNAAVNIFRYVVTVFRRSRSRRRNRVGKISTRLVIVIIVGGIFIRFISEQINILDISSSAPKPTVNSTKTVNPIGWIWIGIVKNTSGSLSVGKSLILQPQNSKYFPSISPAVVPLSGAIVTVKYEVNLRKEKSLSAEPIVKLNKGQKLVILKVESLPNINKNSPYIQLRAQVRKCNSTCNK